MINEKIIDIQATSRIIVALMQKTIEGLQEWQYKISDNVTASVWIFLLAFFVIDVIVYALFRGYEVK